MKKVLLLIFGFSLAYSWGIIDKATIGNGGKYTVVCDDNRTVLNIDYSNVAYSFTINGQSFNTMSQAVEANCQ